MIEKARRIPEEVLQEAILGFGDTVDNYDLSNFIETIDLDSHNAECTCKVCNHTYRKGFSEFKRGLAYCPVCSRKKGYEKMKVKLEDFIIRCRLIHGNNYDYSLVDFNGKILANKQTFICKKHNHKFDQTAKNHVTGDTCPLCANERRAEATRKRYNKTN